MTYKENYLKLVHGINFQLMLIREEGINSPASNSISVQTGKSYQGKHTASWTGWVIWEVS